MLRIDCGKFVLTIRNPKLFLLNVIITWVLLFLWACDLLPKWWYNLMFRLGSGGTYYIY